jgi:hypothetical protein
LRRRLVIVTRYARLVSLITARRRASVTMSAMPSLRLFLTSALTAAALAACSSDTTILLRVTRDATVAASVPRLHVALGVRAPSDVLAPATGDPPTATVPTYVDDVAAIDRVDTSAVDLAAAPYEILLHPSQQLTLDTGLELAAVAFDGDGDTAKPLAFGALGHEVHFHQGEELIYEITLTAVGGVTADPARRDCGTLAGAASSIFACRPGCVRFTGDRGAVWIGAQDDIDCDGDAHGSDCDDYDWTVNHRATDICNNGKNDDCTGGVDDGVDRDGDGLTPCQGDCVDNPQVPGSKDIHPGAVDDPHDGVDNNCSGRCDETDDVDGDTWTKTGFRTTDPSPIDRACAAAAPDCNDNVASINPGATEIDGNGFDDDCNGTCDTDADGDGYTRGDGKTGVREPPMAGTAQCAPSVADCDDDPADVRNGTPAAMIHPNAPEICDAVDDNCNGQCDEGLDLDGDHFTVCGTVNDAATACTWVGSSTCPDGAKCDCAEGKPNIYPGGPGPELCDGYDESCDGVLYAKDTPCFVLDGNNVCHVGSRACDDTTPPGAFGACTPTAQTAPPEACTAYQACQGSSDPILCIAGQLGNATNLGCQAALDRTQAPPGLCPMPPATYVAPLPQVAGTNACNQLDWTILGGATHGAWTVGLVDGTTTGGTPQPMIAGTCTAALVVTQVAGPAGATQPPPPSTFFVVAHRGPMAQIVVINLSGVVNGDCPDGPALQCHGG